MSYVLNKTTGEILITLQDGTGDGPDINPGINVSDLDLFGKNYPLYGQYLDENFVKLLQNFANVTPPSAPLEGELWYDISVPANQILRVYTGTSWLPVTPVWVSNSAPTTNQIGAQWWDQTNNQLNMYNGSTWTLVGPSYKATDGISGSLVEDVTDIYGNSHTVIKFYTNGNVSAIVGYDQPFTLSNASSVSGFGVISPGITLSSEANNLFHGTAVNSQQLGNIAAANYARTDIDSTFNANIFVGGGNLEITTSSSGTSKFINNVTNGNISFHANVSGVSTKLLHINATTGELLVTADPTSNLGLATKQYVDNSISTATSPLAPLNSPVFAGTPTAPTPAVGTSSTQIATTAFVQTMLTVSNSALWLGSQKTVSNVAPTPGTGNPGDFWFQI